MAEWTSKVVADEWDRRAAGKYGAELAAESLGMMADVMFGTPPRFDFVEWARTVRYKPTATVSGDYDMANRCYVLAVSMSVPDVRHPDKVVGVYRQELLGAHVLDGLTAEEGEKVATRILRHLIVDLEHHEIDEWLTIDGVRVREPEHG